MAKVEAPNKGYSGTGPAGVVFKDGVANTDDEAALNYFRAAGYTVDGDTPALDEPEGPADPRDQEESIVGTRLRDAAVDPEPTDFLAPINAGEANPHGPAVISPEIHTSGPKGIRPGEVFVDDHGKQEAREQAFAELVLADQVDANEAVASEVPDLDARGELGLSDPGSASIGAAQATAKPTGAEGDAAAGSEEVPLEVQAGVTAPATVPPADPEAEKPAGNASTAEWRTYAVSQGLSEDEANSLSRDDLRDRYSA